MTISETDCLMDLKTCPNCGREILSLITDYANGKRYCYHCIPNPEASPGAVFISRKMDQLHAAGKLETYSVEQRLKDLNDPPRCECSAVLDILDSEVCSKCEGEAFRLAHRIRQCRAPDHPVNPKERVANREKGRIKGDVGPELVDFVFRRCGLSQSRFARACAFSLGDILLIVFSSSFPNCSKVIPFVGFLFCILFLLMSLSHLIRRLSRMFVSIAIPD